LPEPKKNGNGNTWTLIGEHIYYDEHGERFLKVRKCRDGDGKKQYPQYHWDGNGWAKGKPEGSKIPYGLPQLIAAPTASIVYFVEGEKDADHLAKIGFVATTASEGAAANGIRRSRNISRIATSSFFRTLTSPAVSMGRRLLRQLTTLPRRCGFSISIPSGTMAAMSRIGL
jgi:hypothetical protein